MHTCTHMHTHAGTRSAKMLTRAPGNSEHLLSAFVDLQWLPYHRSLSVFAALHALVIRYLLKKKKKKRESFALRSAE